MSSIVRLAALGAVLAALSLSGCVWEEGHHGHDGYVWHDGYRYEHGDRVDREGHRDARWCDAHRDYEYCR